MSETQVDTTPSPEVTTSEPSVAAPDAATTTETEGTASETETSVLGGDIKDEAVVEETPAAVVPEAYELALEGVTLDPALIDEATPIFKELGLTNDQANALLPLAPKLMEKAQEATMQSLIEAGAQQRQTWLEAFKADPDIGGAKMEETTHLAAKGLDAIGFVEGHPFRKALTESGFGNHPDMIRMARRLGELVSEDGDFVRAGAGSSTSDPLTDLYPNNRRSK